MSLQQNSISRLPASDIETSDRGKFSPVKIGHVHIDSAELRQSEGEIHKFLAIDQVSKFTYVEFHDSVGKINGADFLRGVINAFPYKMHAVVTDNGMSFTDLPQNRGTLLNTVLGMYIFGRGCQQNSVVHKLTKPYHPWTNGQAERLNRTIKACTTLIWKVSRSMG